MNKREIYNFFNEVWQYIKHTPAPSQDDNEAWEKLVDKNSKLSKEFIKRLNDWMEMLKEESMRGTT